jgi:hypothetical protein
LNCVNNENVAVFPTVFELTKQNEVSITDGILEIIKCHLENLRIQFLKSFPETEGEATPMIGLQTLFIPPP